MSETIHDEIVNKFPKDHLQFFNNLTLSYQWRLGQTHNFFSLGVSSYAYEYRSYSYYGDGEPKKGQTFVPVLSIDRRFGF